MYKQELKISYNFILLKMTYQEILRFLTEKKISSLLFLTSTTLSNLQP